MENDNPVYIVVIAANNKVKKIQPFTSPSLAVNFLNSCIDIQFETKSLTEHIIGDRLRNTEYEGTDIFIRFIDEIS